MTLEYKDLEQRPNTCTTDLKQTTPMTAQQRNFPTNLATPNLGAGTPTGPQTPGGGGNNIGKPLI